MQGNVPAPRPRYRCPPRGPGYYDALRAIHLDLPRGRSPREDPPRSWESFTSHEDTHLLYTASGRTKMESADAVSPTTWRIMPKSGGNYTISPPSTRPQAIVQQGLDVTLREAQFQWLVVLGDEVCLQGGRTSGFGIIPAGKADGRQCRDLLGSRSSDRVGRHSMPKDLRILYTYTMQKLYT